MDTEIFEFFTDESWCLISAQGLLSSLHQLQPFQFLLLLKSWYIWYINMWLSENFHDDNIFYGTT